MTPLLLCHPKSSNCARLPVRKEKEGEARAKREENETVSSRRFEQRLKLDRVEAHQRREEMMVVMLEAVLQTN
ncbi:hypothetical protein GN958_ATG08959 [Phytophthora infestans]|uniref:Uncharacterized protein n=1 Tax=Phytophthora infestans TaxID=4787 RepID=A0A8S9US32_PHYIN|nr:hypothetical protein GN958_ATG08959 [Phytophthora infestans]